MTQPTPSLSHPTPEATVTNAPGVAPSDALLSLIVARTVDAVGRIVDPIRVEEDAVVRIVADYADVESTHGAALVEAVARRVGSDIDLSDVAANIDLSDVAANIDLSDLAGHLAGEIDVSEFASHLSVDDIADCIGASEVAAALDVTDLAQALSESYTLAREVAERIDFSNVAEHVDVDPDAVAACLDLDDLARRVRRDLPPDVTERIERLEERLAMAEEAVVTVETATGPLSAMDAALDHHRERLVAMEERLAKVETHNPAGDLVTVQVGPALPTAAVTVNVLDAVIDRTVDALLAALNAAAAEGRL